MVGALEKDKLEGESRFSRGKRIQHLGVARNAPRLEAQVTNVRDGTFVEISLCRIASYCTVLDDVKILSNSQIIQKL
jgi:hypothetical protein